MDRRPHLVRALLGLGVLIFGVLVYLLDRQSDHVYFLYLLASWLPVTHPLGAFLGPLGNQFPTFAHVYAFILISSALLLWSRIGTIGLCAAWLIIDSAFEVAQHPALAPWVAQAVPGWFAGVPFIENTTGYFLNGTFDPLDLFSIAVGTIAAFVTIRLTDLQDGPRPIPPRPQWAFQWAPLLVVLGAVGGLTIMGSGECEPGDSPYDYWREITSGDICRDSAQSPAPAGPIQAVAERFPVVAVDGNGRALILSRGRVDEDPQKPVHLFASTYEFATGVLSPATDLVTAGGSVQTLVALTHALAMDESGNGTALWSAFNGGLYANHFDQSAGWGQAALLSGATISDYRIAMDGFGRALAVWAEGEDLFARDYPSSSSGWQNVHLVRNGPGLVLGDAVYRAFGYAVWRETPPTLGGFGLLYASRFTGNQGWEPALNFWTSNDNNPPRMALHRQAPSESPTAVWQDSGKILSANLSPGVGWEVPEDGILGSDGGIRPQVAMAANLETIAVWEANGEIFASRFASGSWGLAEGISSGTFSPGSSRVATDATGNAIAVWRGPGSKVFANRFVRGTGWQSEQEIGADLVSSGQPEVAMDNSGRTIVVWEGIDPGNQSKTRNVLYVFEGFDLPSDPVTLDLASSPGAEASIFLTITRTGSTGAVDIAFIGCPTNVTCAAVPNPILGGQNSTTVSFTSDVSPPAADDYEVTIQATGGGITRSKIVTLHIQGGVAP